MVVRYFEFKRGCVRRPCGSSVCFCLASCRTLQLRFSNSGAILPKRPSSVVQTGV